MSRTAVFTAIAGLLALAAGISVAQDTIVNPNFDSSDGWSLNQGGTSGTARILGGFLELSVSFPGDFAQARQHCTATGAERTIQVSINDFGLGTTNFRMGWQNAAGTAGDYVTVTHSGTARVTTSNPAYDWIVFRADRDAIGLSAQGLDNVIAADIPSPEAIAGGIIGEQPQPAFADRNNSGGVDVGDVVTRVNEVNPTQ